MQHTLFRRLAAATAAVPLLAVVPVLPSSGTGEHSMDVGDLAPVDGAVTLVDTVTGNRSTSSPSTAGAQAAESSAPAAQGPLSVTQTCDPPAVARKGVTTCTVVVVNTGTEQQTVTVATSVTNALKVTGATGATVTGQRSATASAVLAGALPGVPKVAPGDSPAGYIPLSAFGIEPTPIGDEEVINLDVPPFVFAGGTYTRIGVDSNGYSVVGGGDARDNNCCGLPTRPDPAPPNNVLAPFWTDLDGTGAPGIYVTVLSDDFDNSWIVVEHASWIWDTDDMVPLQTWIGVNGVEDVSYAYDPVDMPGDPGQPFLVGAENALGAGKMAEELPTGDLRVTSTEAVPGETLSFTVDVIANNPHGGTVTSTVTSPTLTDPVTVGTEVTVL